MLFAVVQVEIHFGFERQMMHVAPEHQVCPKVEANVVVGGANLFVVLGNLRLELVALFDILGPFGVMEVLDFFVADV